MQSRRFKTATHAHTVERYLRTFTYNCYMRLESLKQDETKWVNHIDNIIHKYHSTGHSITQIKPNAAGNMNITFVLICIFKMQPNIIENTLNKKVAIWLDLNYNLVLLPRVMSRTGVRQDIKL